MKIDVTEDGVLRLKNVFNTILFETEEGEDLVVCMRDGGYEIGIKAPIIKGRATNDYQWYSIRNGTIEKSYPPSLDGILSDTLGSDAEVDETSKRAFKITENVTSDEAEQPPQPVADRMNLLLGELMHDLEKSKAIAEHRLGVIKKLEKNNAQ